jgi:hypothetical protein
VFDKITTHKGMALALMASGALPFIGGAFLALTSAAFARGLQADMIAIAYGAVILSFLGGIRWGAALNQGHAATLLISVLPSLAGFGALLLSSVQSLTLLIIGFAAQAAWDFIAPGQLPQWFVRLRMAVSAVVIACLLIVLMV